MLDIRQRHGVFINRQYTADQSKGGARLRIDPGKLGRAQRLADHRQIVQTEHEAQYASSERGAGCTTFTSESECGQVCVEIEPSILPSMLVGKEPVGSAAADRLNGSRLKDIRAQERFETINRQRAVGDERFEAERVRRCPDGQRAVGE